MNQIDKDNGAPDLKVGLSEMLKGGVILDVINAEQAKIAEQAGAVAVMALERVPADIREQGGVARMSSPELIQGIADAVSIPVMAKCRIGHTAEATILEGLQVDFIDESEVLTPADADHHIDKRRFRVPFVCGACSLGEALRRVAEGASLLRTKGEAGTGDVIEAVRHLRQIRREMRHVLALDADELVAAARDLGAPLSLLERLREEGRLPVPNFAAGGVATPADAALLMQLGAEAVFVGSGIFKSESPERYARAIVNAVADFRDPKGLLAASRGLPGAMRGRDIKALSEPQLLARRGV